MEVMTNIKNINNIDLYYEHYPCPHAKHTIVLIHGFLSSTFSFRRLIPLLVNDFHVLSIDFPPFGKSGKCSRFTYSYKNISSTINELLLDLGLKNTILVGHSMGGQIGLHMVHLNPSLFDKIILICSSAYLKKSKILLKLSSYIPFFYLYVKFWLIRSGVRKNLEAVVYDPSIIDDEMMYGYLHPFIQDDEIFKALTRMIRDREGDLPSKIIQTIDRPCLLIWGDHDRIVPLSVGERLHRELPNSKLIVLKNTGHLVPEEKPEDTYYYIKNFVLSGNITSS